MRWQGRLSQDRSIFDGPYNRPKGVMFLQKPLACWAIETDQICAQFPGPPPNEDELLATSLPILGLARFLPLSEFCHASREMLAAMFRIAICEAMRAGGGPS